MNLFTLFSLNKHGRHREVLFSSAISFLLRGESGEFASWFAQELLSATGCPEPNDYRLKASQHEYDLGNGSGQIDNLITFTHNKSGEELLLGLEVKVHDSSSDRGVSSDSPQLERYADALRSKCKNWRLLFLVPNERSEQCQDAFNELKAYLIHVAPGQEGRSTMLYWHCTASEEIMGAPTIFKIIGQVGRPATEGVVQQILIDLLKFIDEDPLFNSARQEGDTFPSKYELLNCLDSQSLKSMYRFYSKKGTIQPAHTTVGIRFGRGANRRKFHGNAVYRVRTTQAYRCTQNTRFPKVLEIEIWPDVTSHLTERLEKLEADYKPLQFKLISDWHIDADYELRTQPVQLLCIDPKMLADNPIVDITKMLEDLHEALVSAYNLSDPEQIMSLP